jgi:hypothetical protein
MQHPFRVLATAGLLALVVASMMQPALAGSQEEPEVTDPAQDQLGPGGTPGCAQGQCPVTGTRVDIISAWVENETADSFQLHIRTTGVPPSSTFSLNYSFAFTVAGTTYTAGINVLCGASTATPCNSAVTPWGVASSAAISAVGVMMTVNKTSLGSPAAGAMLTDLTIGATALLVTTTQVIGTDSAGPGGNYTLLSGAGAANPGDTDADGLNDTWEMQHFGNLAQNATMDGDADGCDNKCEFDHGTDPKKADTDGDGCKDGEEIKAGKDPKDPNSYPAGCATTGTNTTSPTTTGSPTTGTPTTTPTTGTTTDGGDGGERSVGERFQDALDSGYLVIAGAGALVIALFALIARGTRWGL